ncbi:MAG: ribosome biogenesis/translation initiation ATPase RLI [Sulfolobales archaeon]|nr:ribosome biogenesis/translation initiation ATPase RLI [Sulfolobales archaeon]MCX8208218.1 ribosome biogenesis/translation initiation ATPase RLI [Sulfolobales archaeon]MDW8010630.1 ribosome biogenesis/translation initiation ATPase RLI [Sulfolobales archaeon]
MVRVASIDRGLCNPRKCQLECVRFCPINRTGKKAVEVPQDVGKAVIYEDVCVGCGICVKKCPFQAIAVVNLPDELEKYVIHRYGRNAFKLYGLPVPQEGRVVGVIGRNGIGKTTAVRILAGEIVPNLGALNSSPSWDEALKFFRGSELYNYFSKLVNKKIRVVHKIQHVDAVRVYVRGFVREVLEKIDERGLLGELGKFLNLELVLDKKISTLSGGELQKVAITAALLRDADVYVFDEPASYLDVRERLRVSRAIRRYVPSGAYAIVVEHDLAVVDYIADLVSVVYGEPGVYGVYSKVYSVGSGINHFLGGYLPAENMRIRSEPVVFSAKPEQRVLELEHRQVYLTWPEMSKSLNGFTLSVNQGEIRVGEVVGVVGPNGIGKTTFARLIVGEIEPDVGYVPFRGLRISYKPQYIKGEEFPWEYVGEALDSISKEGIASSEWFAEEVVRKFKLHKLKEKKIKELSGGELQKFSIAIALARDAELYVLDEPSAFLDVDERLAVARAIRKIIEGRKTACLVIDHDIMLIDYISDRLIVFSGEPGARGLSIGPVDVRRGMNALLRELEVTFRRDVKTGRPRVNKPDSYLDRYLKSIGEYYYMKPAEDKES